MRTADLTRKQISEQYDRTLIPSSHSALEKLIRSSGTKDTFAFPIIGKLLRLGDEIWKNRPPEMKKPEFSNVMKIELTRIQIEGEMINPLLNMPGVPISCLYLL